MPLTVARRWHRHPLQLTGFSHEFALEKMWEVGNNSDTETKRLKELLAL